MTDERRGVIADGRVAASVVVGSTEELAASDVETFVGGGPVASVPVDDIITTKVSRCITIVISTTLNCSSINQNRCRRNATRNICVINSVYAAIVTANISCGIVTITIASTIGTMFLESTEDISLRCQNTAVDSIIVTSRTISYIITASISTNITRKISTNDARISRIINTIKSLITTIILSRIIASNTTSKLWVTQS